MKRRQFLKKTVAPLVGLSVIACDVDVHLEEEFFNKENLVKERNGRDSFYNFYYNYEKKPGKFVVVRVDSLKLAKGYYGEGDYTLKYTSKGFGRKRIYDLIEK